MFETLRRKFTSLRKFVANRRRAERYKTLHNGRLLFNVSIISDEERNNRIQTIPLIGYTRDISETGLALIVPTLRVGDRYLVDEGCTLKVVLLDLPEGQVEIFATPVRHELLKEPEVGHLLGVQIKKMSESDRERFSQYIKTLR